MVRSYTPFTATTTHVKIINQSTLSMTSNQTYFYALLLAIVSFLFGYYLAYETPDSKTEQLRLKSPEFSFINPLLDYQEPKNTLMRREVRELELEINQIIEQSKLDEQITEASVYYRDLNNGPWFFINDDTYFTPASLLKVPVMITYFKMAEKNPDILKQTLTFTTPYSNISNHIFSEEVTEIQVGQTYTILELIESMIINSDNYATVLLQENIDTELQAKVYSDFAINLPHETNSREQFITTQAYASFLRILYNATYLNKQYSEMALEILSRSKFKDGIKAGVSDNVKVSNKYGIFEKNAILNEGLQLHDCGIIYDTKTYVVCIMTHGHDYETMTKLIKDITHQIFIQNRKQP